MSDGCSECGHPEGGHNARCSISIRERNAEIDRLRDDLGAALVRENNLIAEVERLRALLQYQNIYE